MAYDRYSFEHWMLDCWRGALTGPDGEVTLRPKTFEVLRFLVENAGRLVSRDEVLDAVWRNVTVTEESLTHCVSEIRQALGDAEQRVIKTVPRRGYLFAASVCARVPGPCTLPAEALSRGPYSTQRMPAARPARAAGPDLARRDVGAPGPERGGDGRGHRRAEAFAKAGHPLAASPAVPEL
jgi:DNA-binding winged helix-turn-helix (wHTH) protein